jgi:predicted acetyltransferase
MGVSLLEPDDIPQARSLWKEAFGDTDEFIEWYFNNKVLPGNSIGVFDGGLISVLHMIPFTISIQKKPVASAFIAGAATSSRRRNEGHMRVLLYEALALLKSRGITMTHLYPFKHSFYENFGWAAYSYMHKLNSENAKSVSGVEIREDAGTEVFDSLYKKMMAGHDGYVIRGKREWEWRIGELKADGGRSAVACDGGEPKAYMLFFCEEDKIDVIETVYSDEYYIRPLLGFISEKWGKNIEYRIPAAWHENAEPFGMARIVDAERLLGFFGAEDMLDCIKIRDDFAGWNNIGSGKEISINEAAAMVHGTTGKKVSGVMSGKGGFLDQNACIFEEY